ncbi:titin-like [Acipenser ruthenus]|uniref:titin-like n=1 Tax=Acipenser ruthenus TaxID=7906 RepID=UPI002740F55A|nr:titin-like [Acipenser ruthenus]
MPQQQRAPSRPISCQRNPQREAGVQRFFTGREIFLHDEKQLSERRRIPRCGSNKSLTNKSRPNLKGLLATTPTHVTSPTAGKPKPVLTQKPAGEISEGYTVTLSCVVEGDSDGWRYLWYKDSQGTPAPQTDSSSGTGAGYTISPAALSHSGEYWCRAERGSKPFDSDYSSAVSVQVSELFTSPALTVMPGVSVWEGETVTLKCGVKTNKQGALLQYRYSKENRNVREARSRNPYSIPAAELSDTGSYQCEVEAAGTGVKKKSDSVSLTVKELFTSPALTVMPGVSVWEGETVTLKCGVKTNKQGALLQYRYSKENRNVREARSRNPYSIPAAELSDTGSYQCEVEAAGTGVKKKSDSVSLTVKELFTSPALTVMPGVSVWEGETVTLKCGVKTNKQGALLQYRYSKENRNVREARSRNPYSIPAAELSDTGSYQCEVEAAGTGVKKKSDSVSLTVKELFTSPALTVKPRASVWEGETVTLQCGAQIYKQGTQLQYRYIKDNGDLSGARSRDPYSIPAAELRDTGSYQCEVQAAGTGLKKRSDYVWLSVKELFTTPSLTFTPVSPVWEGEAVTLQCGAQIYKQGTQLQYRYIKDNGNLSGAGSQDQYSIPVAGLRDTGSYQCEVEAAGTGLKKKSDSVSLTVKELPQPTITLKPPFPEIFTGETVTLRCGVEGGSAGWKYLWYKDNEDTPVLQTAGRSITGDSYTITAAAVSDQGQYWCRGQRGDQPLYSQLSDPEILNITDVRPKAVLTLHPAWTQIFTGETVTLSCEVGGSAGWGFKQYRDGREEAGCSDQYRRRDGDSCTISNAQHYHSGVYWCESTSGQERSNAVTLTVSNEWVILQTPPQPVIEGDALTLRCRVRYNYHITKVVFYKDNKELQSQADTELSVNRVSKSDEGSYKCRARWWSSYHYSEGYAEVRVSVRGLPQTTLTLEPPFPEIFTGDTFTLRCGVKGGSAGWKYLWYKDSEVTPMLQTAGRSITGDSYTITAAAVSDQGQYCCRGQRGDQPLYSQLSDKVILTVSELFTSPALTVIPDASVWEGETVTLQCGAQINKQGTQLQYHYIKDNGNLRGAGSRDPYSIPAAQLRDTGSYQCEVEAAGTGVKKISDSVSLTVKERPQAVLTQEPAWTQIYESESVTLRCEVQGDYTDWRFTWYKARRNAPVTQYYYSRIDDKYTISSATQYHSGEYTCKGERTDNPSYSKTSNALTLRVSERPQAVLTQEPAWTQIYESERVTLRCQIPGDYTDWRFTWYKARRNAPVTQDSYSSIDGDRYTISYATRDHSGEYTCKGERTGNPSYSKTSDALTLRVSERPQAVLTQEPAWTQIYKSERVTLRCQVQGDYTGWRFSWYKARRNAPVTQDSYSSIDGDRYTISYATKDHSGEYTCKGERTGNPSYSKTSDGLTLRVSAGKPKSVLTQEPAGEISEGDKVTLSCVVEGGSGGWRYLWYKGSQYSTPLHQTDSSSGTGAGYTISPAALSHSGYYLCRAERGSNPFNSDYSSAVKIQVSERPKAVLTQEPAWTQIFKSESVTLRCEVQGDYTDWRFTWYKDGRNAPVTQNSYSSIDGDRYTISSATKGHSGEYTCKGERTGNPSYSKTSDALTLRVSAGKPKPVLTQEPAGEIFEGDTVTLSCVVEGGSDGWRYLWYKDKQYSTPVYQTNSSSGTGAGYTISAATLSHSGEYWCRAERGRNPFNSDYSNAVNIQVSEVHPKAVLTLHPAWTQIFPADTVTLRCEVEGGSAGWGFKQYRDGREEAGCSDQYSRRYGDSCTISTAQYNHSGVYWCESASGQERSNAVNLTVSNEDVILQTPPQPVIEGDSLTLRCRVRTNYTFTRIVFFKDNEEIQSQNNTELSVDRVSKSDEGSYKCRAMWNSSTYSGDSAEVRVSVRELFSWVTLTASPGATVKEGEALNLTCEAAVNKTPRPQLHYTIVRDGEPVTNSTDSALYSIASTEKSHTGSYTCAVESQGVKKSSQELHIEVEMLTTVACFGQETDKRDGKNGAEDAQHQADGINGKQDEEHRDLPATTTSPPTTGKPKPVLTRKPAGEISEGYTVTLSCVVEGDSDGWRYLWYKDSQGTLAPQTDSSSGTGAGYTISPAALSHSGEYWCRAERGSKPFDSDYSSAVSVQVSELFTSPALTVMPDASVWEGETVTLQCGAQINKQGTQLQYHYIKDNGNLRGAGSRDPYSIPAAQLRDTGSYQCEVEAAGTGVKKMSDIVSLTVKELPKAVLTSSPQWRNLYTGETVTLSCGVEGSFTGWEYLWYKSSQRGTEKIRGTTGARYTLSPVTQSHSGEYQCEAQRGDRPRSSQGSDSVTLTVSELPKAVLTSSPQWRNLYTGETVTLSCGVEGSFTGWEYLWYKSSQRGTEKIRGTTGARYTLSPVTQSHSGQYQCEAQRGDRPRSSQGSDSVTLTVSELPKAVLTSSPQWRNLYTGETVTLSCGVEGSFTGWEYLWYKSSQRGTEKIRGTTGARYTLSPVTQSHSGQYQCEAQRGDRPRSSQGSDSVTLTVSELPKVVLTSSPQWRNLYTGETVTLKCGVQGSFTGWRYLWYKSSQGGTVKIRDTTGASFTLSPVTQSHSGQYLCEAQRGDRPRSSQRSDSVTLTVSAGKPKPVLNREPAREIFEGDTVTLSCVVEGGSDGWRYLWHKGSQYSTPVYQTDSSSGTGAGYTISAAALSHSGEYWCRAGRSRNTFYSQYSSAVNIQVSEQPQAVLTQEPAWTQIYKSESVTLRCQVQGDYTDWRFTWYKAGRNAPVTQDSYSSIDGDSYTISSATRDHSGEYTCKGERTGNPSYSKTSDALTLRVSASKPKPVLTREPAGEIFEGDTVTLSCVVEGGSDGWRYLWYKDRQGAPVYQTDSSSGTGVGYTISAAALSQSTGGEYRCLAGRGSKPFNSDYSNAVKIKVSELFSTPTLTVTPHASVWEGEAVTLQCGAQINKQGTQLQNRYITVNGDQRGAGSQDQYSIPAAGLRDTGSYQCEVEAAGTGVKKRSDSVWLSVRAGKPKPVLTREPAREIFEGDTVTLSCVVEGSSDGWRYLWYKDRQYSTPVYQTDSSSGTGAGYTISAAALSHSGEYWCRAGRGSNPFYSEYSNAVKIQVSERPQAVLTQEPAWTQIYESERVTLRCEVQGDYTDWRFTWYKAGRNAPVTQDYYSRIARDRYTISSAAQYHSGEYTCQGVRTGNPSYSTISNSLTLRVSAGKPKPVLTREPAGEIFEGDTVTLSCVVEGGSDGWRYLWYKDSLRTSAPQTDSSSGTGARYTISAAALSHSGEYCCRAGRGSKPFNSDYSKGVKIKVSGLPQTTLTLEPPFPEICTGETVTLRCGVKGGSAGWKYLWYKDSEDTPVLQTAVRSITGDSYTITAAAVSDQGQYCCRGQRGDQPLYSQLSDKVILTVSEVRPKAVLTLQPAWAQIFTGETVTLRCEVEGCSAGWRFKQYRDGREEAWCSDQYSRRDGHSCTISNAQNSHSGVYWCESGQERSNAVNLAVSNERVILQTPPQPVFEGDALTLKCRDRYNYHITTVAFYKDNKELQSQADTELSANRVSKSDEGSYKCRAWWWSTYLGDSAEVQVSVRELFSRVTLTASPGATVKEGGALNLTCEAAVNKTPRPQLHYTIVRDGDPVTNSTDSALYSIASTEKSHTGSYTCAVESQGVRKSSQELHIEVQKSWLWIIGPLSGSLVLIILIVVTILLFYRYKTKGFLFIAAKSRSPADQTPAQLSRGMELSGFGQQPGNSTASNLESVYTEVKPYQQNKAVHVTDTPSTSNGDDILYSVIDLKNTKPAKPRSKQDCDVLYSTVLVKKPEDNPSAADNSDVLYSELDMKNVNKKKKKGKTLAGNQPEVLYSEINQAKPSGKPAADNAEPMYAAVLPKKKRK